MQRLLTIANVTFCRHDLVLLIGLSLMHIVTGRGRSLFDNSIDLLVFSQNKSVIVLASRAATYSSYVDAQTIRRFDNDRTTSYA